MDFAVDSVTRIPLASMLVLPIAPNFVGAFYRAGGACHVIIAAFAVGLAAEHGPVRGLLSSAPRAMRIGEGAGMHRQMILALRRIQPRDSRIPG